MPAELWTEVHDIVQETWSKTVSKKTKCKKAKWLSEEALQIAVKRREAKSKGEKERYTHLNAEFQRRARRDVRECLTGGFLCVVSHKSSVPYQLLPEASRTARSSQD